MAGLGGFHTSRPFLQRSDAVLTSRIRRDVSDYERAMLREREKQEEHAKATELHKKELEKIKMARKTPVTEEASPEGDEEGDEEDPLRKTQKAATGKDPMFEAVKQQAKAVNYQDSFRRGSHFGAKHHKTPEFGTHPMSARMWERNCEPVFVSLKPLALPPVEGLPRLAGHVPKTDKGFWRRTPGVVKVPEPPPKRTIPRLEPADHRNDPFDHPPPRSWLHDEPHDSPTSGRMTHTFTSYARRKKHWPCKDEGRGIAPPMWAI